MASRDEVLKLLLGEIDKELAKWERLSNSVAVHGGQDAVIVPFGEIKRLTERLKVFHRALSALKA